MTNKDERDTAIVKAKSEGLSYRALAEQFGLSSGRIKQIVARGKRKLERSPYGDDGTLQTSQLHVRAFCFLQRIGFSDSSTRAEVLQRLPDIREAAKSQGRRANRGPNFGKKSLKEIEDWLGVEPERTTVPMTCPHCGGVVHRH